MYQGKLEVVKQEMARMNIDILGISEVKWIGMKTDHESRQIGSGQTGDGKSEHRHLRNQ